MYTREQAKAIVDKILNLAKADAVEVNLTGGERSGTRWANSSITTNLVQYDRQVTVTVRIGQKTGNANTRDFSDAGLQAIVNEAVAEAQQAEPGKTSLSCSVRRSTSLWTPRCPTW
jgi:predicted Zn-dependent protease